MPAIKSLLKLDLGCGNHPTPGFAGVDNNPHLKQIDYRVDLNKTPWPFPDNSVSEIVANHVAEHVEDLTVFMDEIGRICQNGATAIIRVPHFSAGFAHPLHRRGFSISSFEFYASDSEEHYGTTASFQINHVKLSWQRPGSKQNAITKALDHIITPLANISPRICERLWCYWVGGFEEIKFDLTVEK